MLNFELNAWCDYPNVDVAHSKNGPLAGLTLAVKDIFPVTGYPNGWGQPTRLAEAKPDTQTQVIIQKMLDAGIQCLGKSQCEELCFSLMGINAHYGAPLNAAAPERITGGSSSGSASLIAAGVVDVATASDTGGSVRAPASFCGIIGLRTTHGRVSLKNTMPLAPSFDCFGWFAKDIETYRKVGDVILGDDNSETELSTSICIPEFENLLSGNEEVLAFNNASKAIQHVFKKQKIIDRLPIDLTIACETFIKCQAYEAWNSLGEWITTRKPDLGPGVKERFAFGASLSKNNFDEAYDMRKKLRIVLETLIGSNGVLILPTVPSCAPLKNENHHALEQFRYKMLQLLCLSGLSGLPQISLPLANVHDAPFGISLLGPRGSDRRLIDLAHKIMA